MRIVVAALVVLVPLSAGASNCRDESPSYSPIATTFERSCQPGQRVVEVLTAKSPVVKLNFGSAQEVTIETHSGAKSSGGNGKDAQVCIWQSWEPSRPCGRSAVSQDGFREWDGKASCSVNVPAGVQYVRALQTNSSADEHNTTIVIRCR